MRCQMRDCRTPMVASLTESGLHVCPSCGAAIRLQDAADCAGPSSLTKPGLAVQLGVKKKDASGLFAELES